MTSASSPLAEAPDTAVPSAASATPRCDRTYPRTSWTEKSSCGHVPGVPVWSAELVRTGLAVLVLAGADGHGS